jgi:hypothetical protein
MSATSTSSPPDATSTPSPSDRAAVGATAILSVISSSPTPQDLRARVEAMLRDEFHDIRRELIQEIRTRLYE